MHLLNCSMARVTYYQTQLYARVLNMWESQGILKRPLFGPYRPLIKDIGDAAEAAFGHVLEHDDWCKSCLARRYYGAKCKTEHTREDTMRPSSLTTWAVYTCRPKSSSICLFLTWISVLLVPRPAHRLNPTLSTYPPPKQTFP